MEENILFQQSFKNSVSLFFHHRENALSGLEPHSAMENQDKMRNYPEKTSFIF